MLNKNMHTFKDHGKMKASSKLLISGILTIITVVFAGEMFDAVGVIYGPAQAGLAGLAGVASSIRLFHGS